MIGAVIAMEIEAEILLSQMEIENVLSINGKSTYVGKAFGKEIVLVVCGVGKVNAAVGACICIEKGASTLLNFGVAGGLHSRTEVAEIYLVDRAVQYDFDLTQLNGTAIGTLDEYEENYLPLTLPRLKGERFETRALASGDRFNDSPVDHALLTEELQADMRDMEGAAIAQVCKPTGIPFVSVKAISDVYGGGSTTEQYLVNRERALAHLKAHLKDIITSLE